MQIVIDIDDEQLLFDIKNRELYGETETEQVILKALYNGTPLPKGHGKLIDVDDLTWARHTVDKYGYEEDIVVSWDDIVDAPTIIEADKE